MSASRDEFALIEHYFAPLARGEVGAFDLEDDAAVLAPGPGFEFVITTDALVAGVHFLADDPPGDIARKALRVNLSDIAAMGGRPRAVTLASALPAAIDDAWLDGFAAGLAADVEAYSIALIGGDTVATPGPLTLSITAIGEVPTGRAVRRNGARAGDAVFVSGTIGDAVLGLALATGRLASSAEDRASLVERYRLPRPRTRLGPALVGLATAMIDVSDGLVADLGHIARRSGLAAEIELPQVPLSGAASRLLADDPDLFPDLLTGGDDYELLFTAPVDREGAVVDAAATAGIAVSRIGRMLKGTGIVVRDRDDRPLSLGRTGFLHFGMES